MAQRLFFVTVTVLFVTMNVLLWRSEYSDRNSAGGVVPVEKVWEKILTAPDNSSLEIFHHHKKIGFCRWAATVGEELSSSKSFDADGPPEGMVKRVTGYRIDFDGNISLKDLPSRMQFNLDVSFATNHAWQEVTLSFAMRPLTWEFHTAASGQMLRVRTGDETGESERLFKYSDLQNPNWLLQDLGNPFPLPFLSASLPFNPQMQLGLQWEARNDWCIIGHTSVRAYLLECRILDRYSIRIFVSRVGEILRVELPDEILLVNDQLTTL